MPDSSHRPLVRKISAEQRNFLTRFDKSNPSSSTAPEIGRNYRSGSVKSSPKTHRDSALEEKVLQWITSVIEEKPTAEYEHFIQDGSVLSKVMTSIVFNSVPMEDINASWGANPALDRTKSVIREIKRYGVIEVFEPEDLLELRNIPKVTKCLAQLSKLAASDKDNLLNAY